MVKARIRNMRSFNTVEELKEALVEEGCEGAVVFVNPDYLEAVVGYDDEGRVVYNYDRMIESLIDEGMTEEEAPRPRTMGEQPIHLWLG